MEMGGETEYDNPGSPHIPNLANDWNRHELRFLNPPRDPGFRGRAYGPKRGSIPAPILM